MGGDRKYMVAKEIRAAKKPKAAKANARDQLSLNVVTFRAFNSTQPVKTDFLGFDPIAPNRVAVDYVAEGTPGYVPITRSKSERTATVSFGPVLADYPELKVEKGRARLIPWTIDSGRFVLELSQEENVPTPPRGTKKKAKVDSNTHPAEL